MNSVALVPAIRASRWTKVWTGLLVLIGGLLLNQLPWYHSIGIWPDLLTPIVAFFLTVTGAAWCVVGLLRVSRERDLGELSSDTLGISPKAPETATKINPRTRPRRFFPMSILSVPLTVVFGLFYLGMLLLQTGADRTGQCQGLTQAAAETGVIPQSSAFPPGPAVGCGSGRYGMFFSFYNDVTVWGVDDYVKQDQVLQSLSDYQKQNHTLPMRVSFFDKENWTEHPGKNGAVFGQRGPEKLIRIAKIG